MARVALLRAVQIQLLLTTKGGLLKGNGHVGPQALPPLGGIGPLLAAAAEPAEPAAEEGAENIAQVDVSHVEPAEAAPGAEVGIHPRMAELVIFGPLLFVGEHLIGLVDLLELGLGGLVVGVHVRVVLFGQLPVGLFNFIIRGAFADTQDFIVITFLFWHESIHLR